MTNTNPEVVQNLDNSLQFAQLVDVPTGASDEVIGVFSDVFNDAINKYGRPTLMADNTAIYGLSLWLGTNYEALDIFQPYDKSYVSAKIETRITDEHGKGKDVLRKLLLNKDGELLTSEARNTKSVEYSPVADDSAIRSFLYESKGIISEHASFGMQLRSLGRRAITPRFR